LKHIYHRYCLVTVRRPDSENLMVESRYLDTETEMAGLMLVGARDFQVLEARMEIYRDTGGERSVGVIPVGSLRGVVAYPSAISTFRQVLPADPYGRRSDLFLEGLKGLLQAEIFVWEERGFTSMRDYDDWFRREYDNSCVFYTHFDEVTQPYMEDMVNKEYRETCLFNRHRYCSIARLDSGELAVQAGLGDSFHEINITLRIGDSGCITEAAASMLRVPDAVCRRAAEGMGNLVGLPLDLETRKKLMTASGGPEGCAHLADLVIEGAKTLALAKAVGYVS